MKLHYRTSKPGQTKHVFNLKTRQVSKLIEILPVDVGFLNIILEAFSLEVSYQVSHTKLSEYYTARRGDCDGGDDVCLSTLESWVRVLQRITTMIP